jgi:hypothetical protein
VGVVLGHYFRVLTAKHYFIFEPWTIFSQSLSAEVATGTCRYFDLENIAQLHLGSDGGCFIEMIFKFKVQI